MAKTKKTATKKTVAKKPASKKPVATKPSKAVAKKFATKSAKKPTTAKLAKANANMVVVKDIDDLKKLIKDTIKTNGEDCDLNFIDVTQVTNMDGLFYGSPFNGDISKWDVSNVTNMSYMFTDSQFNGDISHWDVSNVTNMQNMFADSQFNGDISQWNVSKVKNMVMMFQNSRFTRDVSKWNVSNVVNMQSMFSDSQFNGNISKWNVSNVTNMFCMFSNSRFKGDISKWDTSKLTLDFGMFDDSPLADNPPKWYGENSESEDVAKPKKATKTAKPVSAKKPKFDGYKIVEECIEELEEDEDGFGCETYPFTDEYGQECLIEMYNYPTVQVLGDNVGFKILPVADMIDEDDEGVGYWQSTIYKNPPYLKALVLKKGFKFNESAYGNDYLFLDDGNGNQIPLFDKNDKPLKVLKDFDHSKFKNYCAFPEDDLIEDDEGKYHLKKNAYKKYSKSQKAEESPKGTVVKKTTEQKMVVAKNKDDLRKKY